MDKDLDNILHEIEKELMHDDETVENPQQQWNDGQNKHYDTKLFGNGQRDGRSLGTRSTAGSNNIDSFTNNDRISNQREGEHIKPSYLDEELRSASGIVLSRFTKNSDDTPMRGVDSEHSIIDGGASQVKHYAKRSKSSLGNNFLNMEGILAPLASLRNGNKRQVPDDARDGNSERHTENTFDSSDLASEASIRTLLAGDQKTFSSLPLLDGDDDDADVVKNVAGNFFPDSKMLENLIYDRYPRSGGDSGSSEKSLKSLEEFYISMRRYYETLRRNNIQPPAKAGLNAISFLGTGKR